MPGTVKRSLRSNLFVLLTVAAAVLLSGCSHRADFPMRVQNETDQDALVLVTITGNVTGHEYYRSSINVSAGSSSASQQVAFEPRKGDRDAIVYHATAGSRVSRYETSMYSSVAGWTVRVLDDRIEAPLAVV